MVERKGRAGFAERGLHTKSEIYLGTMSSCDLETTRKKLTSFQVVYEVLTDDDL